ncbi:MAG: YfiR family protein, partial [Candidatus Sulfotelmatobacter sp.]
MVRIRHIKQVQEGQGCQVVFIDKDERKNVTVLMSGLPKTSVLTVGESDDFLQQGGIIRLFVEDRKIRFEINQEAAETANLRVSSRLLLLAKAVIGGSRR